MTKVYIDTNVFLDFYQASSDRLKVFEELVARADMVILPEQTIREFRRNRSARLAILAKNIQEKPAPTLHATSVIRELELFSAWEKARDELTKNRDAIVSQLRVWIHNDDTDPVLSKFNQLVKVASFLPTSKEAIERARIRKLLGEPPTSGDKLTIGDEVIWETLLHGCKENLIIVSRDNTFLNNDVLLRSEFAELGERELILVTNNLSEALTRVGKPSETVENAELEINKRRLVTKEAICLDCGSKMQTTGFESNDGSSDAWWYVCTDCGYEEFPA